MDFLIWFIFGDVIIAVFAVTLTACCFNILADLIGFPRESVSNIVNTFTYYFWPALIFGGYLSAITKKVKTALMCLLVWLLILVLFCFVPGNITIPEADEVATMEITYAYDMYELGKKVSYKYKGHSFKDPAIIEEVVEMLDDSKYTHAHKEVLTKGDPLYERIMIKFKNADGEILKDLTMINNTGIRVESKMVDRLDRYYRIRRNTVFDPQRIVDLAHNGY